MNARLTVHFILKVYIHGPIDIEILLFTNVNNICHINKVKYYFIKFVLYI